MADLQQHHFDKDIGPVTAYAYAVEHGFFEGTEDEWIELLRNTATEAQNARMNAIAAQAYAKNASNSAISASVSSSYAQELAVAAENSAADAAKEADRAEAAAENKGYMDFEVDESGHLIYRCTIATTNVDFKLVNGNFIVVYS